MLAESAGGTVAPFPDAADPAGRACQDRSATKARPSVSSALVCSPAAVALQRAPPAARPLPYHFECLVSSLASLASLATSHIGGRKKAAAAAAAAMVALKRDDVGGSKCLVGRESIYLTRRPSSAAFTGPRPGRRARSNVADAACREHAQSARPRQTFKKTTLLTQLALAP